MIASKENCREALQNLETQERFMNDYAFNLIKAFLQAAEKRLPSQASLDKDAARKKATRKSPRRV